MRTQPAFLMTLAFLASTLLEASTSDVTPARESASSNSGRFNTHSRSTSSGGQEPRGFFERERQMDCPIVRVVSPAGGAYVSPSRESRLLIVLEIVDVSGWGIVSDDFGVPRFVDEDPNVALFVSHLIAMNRFTDGNNQAVLQLVSEVPVDKLVRDSQRSITAPFDRKSIPPKWRPLAYPIPLDKTVPFAPFTFRVKDRRGARSQDEMPDVPSLVVGFESIGS